MKPIVCGEDAEVFVPDEPCTDCEELRADIEELQECCEEVKGTLETKQNKLIAGEHIAIEETDEGDVISSTGGLNIEFVTEPPEECIGDALIVERPQTATDYVFQDYPLANDSTMLSVTPQAQHTNKYVLKLYQGLSQDEQEEVYSVTADLDTQTGVVGTYTTDEYSIEISINGDDIEADLTVIDTTSDLGITLTFKELTNTKTYVCDNGTPLQIAETVARGSTDIDEETVINIVRNFLTPQVLRQMLGVQEIPIEMTDDNDTVDTWSVLGR